MAELHVQPKRSNYWWLWLIIIILIIAAALYFFSYNNNEVINNSTITDSNYIQQNDSSDTSRLALAGANLWSQVDFNSPDTTFTEVRDENVITKSNAHFVIYSIKDQTLFEEGKSNLTNDGKKCLQLVGTSIKKRFDTADIRIFNSNDSSKPTLLANNREKAISSYLVNQTHLTQKHISVFQKGEPLVLPDKKENNYIVVKR